MTRFDLATDLDCSVEQAWRLLTDPAVKNKWSRGLTTARDAGGDGRMDRAGAVREVKVDLPTRPRVQEVVTCADEPNRFAYRIFKASPLLREYSCSIDIEPTDDGCAVHYIVDVDFVPTVGPFVAPPLRRSIEKSLKGLSEQSRHLATDPQPLPYRRRTPRRRPGGAAALRPQLERYLGHQRMLADELIADEDPKAWFARLCALTTEELLHRIDDGRYAEPEWMMRLMAVLHRRHVSNLHAYTSGGAVSTGWREAWAVCDENDNPRSFRHVAAGIIAASRAHMEDDMPRALAEAYSAVADDRDYREFRADYLDVASVYALAVDRLCAEIPAPFLPRVLRMSGRVLPEMRDAMTRLFYDVESDRLRAFDKGFALACQAGDVPAP